MRQWMKASSRWPDGRLARMTFCCLRTGCSKNDGDKLVAVNTSCSDFRRRLGVNRFICAMFTLVLFLLFLPLLLILRLRSTSRFVHRLVLYKVIKLSVRVVVLGLLNLLNLLAFLLFLLGSSAFLLIDNLLDGDFLPGRWNRGRRYA